MDGVGRLCNSGALVKDLHLQTPQHRPVETVPHQEGAVLSVQGRGDVDPDVLLLVQRTDLNLERVST